MNEPIPNIFDVANAAQLVDFAAETYQASGQANCDIIEHPATDTRAILSIIDNDLVVAFRGTRSLANFVTDARFRRVPLYANSNAEVHEGFRRAFEGVRASLEEAISGMLAGQRELRLWFTGHSLGGALAKLAGLHFASALTSVYTFGEPRVGNAAFRELYQGQLGARTFRVVHGDDIVPRLPWLAGAYRHSGHEVFFGGRARLLPSRGCAAAQPYQVDPSILRKLPYDIRNAVREFRRGRLALLNDHHVAGYCRLFASGFSQQEREEQPSPAATRAPSPVRREREGVRESSHLARL